ncbi:MAG TPA: hypothetical protein VJ816_08210 [Gemmatimonadales bacterium]|nr:hypothetical protein [Gemmatimonadales bacterium]
MPFDMGFDFRAWAGTTPPAYASDVYGEAYPHTYTNVNGYSINGGWDAGVNPTNRDVGGGQDPRIDGINYIGNGTVRTFTIDLSSGSAPGAGTYTVDVAAGDPSAGHNQGFKVFDNTTVVLDGSNGGSGFTTTTGHYIDATLADVAATTSWTGTTTNKTFATTTAKLGIGYGSGDATTIAHFRLTLTAGGGQSVVPVLMAQYRQRGN